MKEKTQLIEHIINKPNGTFIDIGTGGDSIAVMASQIPLGFRPTLIAADIDPLVIQSILKRRPEMKALINSSTGPKINLEILSATNMHSVKDSSISGIQASALVHEVFSYTPVKSSIDQFVSEVCRVLEKDGVLVYRDPKWVDKPLVHCTMIIKNPIAKYYTSLFLPKFLDRTFSLIRDYQDKCCKPTLYSHADVKFNLYLKNSNECKQFSFKEFLRTPIINIDYDKSFSIEAPHGLIAEIQRHYVLFLANYFAPGFIDSDSFKHDLKVKDLHKDTRKIFLNFVKKNSIPMQNDVIKKENFPLCFKELKNLNQIFKEGSKLNITKKPQIISWIQKLYVEGIDKNLIYMFDKETLIVDPKILTLLFQGKDKGISQFITDSVPQGLLEHLKMEGEEHYFYKTTDDLITYFGQFSLFLLKDSDKKNYCLAPIDENSLKEAPRDFYKSILKRDFFVTDQHGNIQEPVTEKNIIHFQLQPKEKAFSIYRRLVLNHKNKYPALQKWMENVESRNSGFSFE
jgi:hypothetical protein